MMSHVRSYLPDSVNNNVMYYAGQVRYMIQPYISNTFSASQITSNIYIGDIASSFNDDALKDQGITHVISVFNGAWETYPENFKYKIIHINDDTWTNIGKYFDESNEFIEMALNDPKNKIMIHCHRGISRSVTLLSAYLLWKRNCDKKIPFEFIDDAVNDVINYIQQRRSIAKPNIGFIKCLVKYVCKLNDYDYDNYNYNEKTKY